MEKLKPQKRIIVLIGITIKYIKSIGNELLLTAIEVIQNATYHQLLLLLIGQPYCRTPVCE